MGVSTREAISTDRLNYSESMELQPFTPGLNISKSQKETSSAGSYRYVCACHHQCNRNSCFQMISKKQGLFLQWKNQSIGMCHRTRCHVNYILLLQLKQTVIELLSR